MCLPLPLVPDMKHLRGGLPVAQIYNIFGPTVYRGTIEAMLPILVRLNSPHQNAGPYRLRVDMPGGATLFLTLDQIEGML